MEYTHARAHSHTSSIDNECENSLIKVSSAINLLPLADETQHFQIENYNQVNGSHQTVQYEMYTVIAGCGCCCLLFILVD